MFVINQNNNKVSSLVYALSLALGIFPCATLANETLTAINNGDSVNIENGQQQSAEVYEAVFFTEYNPQTALDMVVQLPGFSLVETDNDIRGFAAGAGNVLIDGRRPTTKSGGIREALSRIPASHVARIEVIRGASGTSDAAGQAVVANVVQLKETGAKRWELGVGKAKGADLSSNAELLFSKQIQQWDSSIKFNASQDNGARKATTSSYSADNNLQSVELEDRPSRLNEVFLSGDLARQFSPDERLSINARLGWSQFLTDTERRNFLAPIANNVADNSPDSNFRNERNSQYYTGELGIEWQQMINPHWQWRMLSINNARNWFVDSLSNTYSPPNALSAISRLRFDEHNSEHVLRSMLSRSYSNQQGLNRQEYGVEVALNQLESWLKLWDVEKHVRAVDPIRNTYSQAEELRGEVFANLGWQFNKISIEAGLAAEQSTIEVSGDSENKQSLTFVKPSLAIIYNPNQATQYRWETRRSVGQLDFSDFAASADLINDREFSGNATLKPDTKIRTAIAVDHRFSEKGAVTLEAYYEWRKDVLEQIILPSGDHALGNAGDANVRGFNASLNLPLFDYLSGAQLSVVAKFIDAEFDDLITGESRELSDLSNPVINVDFRQDLSDYGMSWGFGYQAYNEYESFYVDEYSYSKTEGRWSTFIEAFVFGDMKMRFSASNLGKEKERWERTLFQPTRSGSVAEYLHTNRTQEPHFSLSISQTF